MTSSRISKLFFFNKIAIVFLLYGSNVFGSSEVVDDISKCIPERKIIEIDMMPFYDPSPRVPLAGKFEVSIIILPDGSVRNADIVSAVVTSGVLHQDRLKKVAESARFERSDRSCRQVLKIELKVTE